MTLASAFESARRWNHIQTNTFRTVRKPNPCGKPPVSFSRDEFRSFVKSVDDVELRELYIFAAFAGSPLSEITARQWTNLDFVHTAVYIQNSEAFTTKSKKNRVVPMNEQLWQLLATRKERATCALVFHSNGKHLTKEMV